MILNYEKTIKIHGDIELILSLGMVLYKYETKLTVREFKRRNSDVYVVFDVGDGAANADTDYYPWEASTHTRTEKIKDGVRFFSLLTEESRVVDNPWSEWLNANHSHHNYKTYWTSSTTFARNSYGYWEQEDQ